MNSNQQVIIELKSGDKCEGVLVNIDKEKMLIKLSNAKRISIGEDGKTREESFPILEIAKDEIKEVKIVQFEPSANQEAKKSELGQNTSLNAIPQNLQNNALNTQNAGKSYDKTGSFFDTLTPMTNKDAQYESIRYNDKNCETFDLPKGSGGSGYYDNATSYGSRRGGQRRGGNRGGYRGGYNNYRNNNNYHNNNYNNHNQNPNNNFYNDNNTSGIGFSANNHPNSGNYGGNFQEENQNFRGRRGGYNNNYNNNRRHNYNNNFNNNDNNNNNSSFPNSNNYGNYSNQFQKQAQMFGSNNNNNSIPNFQMGGEMGQPSFDTNRGNFGDYDRRGRRGQNGGFGGNIYQGRGGNRNKNSNNNRIPNPEFNSINENNDANEQLDDDYSLSIYDKPSSSQAFALQKPQTQNLSVYDTNAGKN